VKVIIATATSPFVYGGATLLVDWLEEALTSRGHEIETYRIPVHASPEELPGQLVGLRMWDLTGHGDRLITIRTPSYLIRHHSKVVWFLHHHRPSYDLWETYPDVPDDGDGREFRRMMFAADEVALAECEHVFTNSRRVSDRLKHWNDIDSEVLYPPLGQSVDLRTGPVGDSLVYVSRVVPHKRQLLAVQAMAHTRTPVKLTVAGGTLGEEYSAAIEYTIERNGLADRVSFRPGVITDEEKRDLLAASLGVVYIPLDEDSYGYVGLEAAASGKALVTTTDSGGVLELVEDGVNGFACDPTPEGLARAFDALYEDRQRAAAMGEALSARVSDVLHIDWDHCIDRLLS
jgi:glycosyltransferase involved in cell wall biosynthesis